MVATDDIFQTRRDFALTDTEQGVLYSLPQLAQSLNVDISRLPVCLRIVLESVLRNCDGRHITAEHVTALANWRADAPASGEIPFTVSRVILQDFTGVPLLADLAAMRDAATARGKSGKSIEPLIPVDLVVDHSIQVDHSSSPDALRLNMEIEFERNRERYQFLKWGMSAFEKFRVIPPGIGIVHQVNLEYLARGVMSRDGVVFPDTVVGTDSHTTMIGGVGIVGWGVGGIEAEAAMLDQPIFILTPQVVGVHLTHALATGITATDLVLHITEMLRKAGVVGKFVEFFGEGASALSVPDRATISNMAPEYGATIGFFATDDKTLDYFRATGRDEDSLQRIRNYYTEQGLFGIPADGQCDYSDVLTLDLRDITPAVAGPKRPQDRIALNDVKPTMLRLLSEEKPAGGFGKSLADPRVAVSAVSATSDLSDSSDVNGVDGFADGFDLGHGDVVIAAITSCTNTSNPTVLLSAALLAKRAREYGLAPKPYVKCSFAPGSRVVEDYLTHSGLLAHLEAIGFGIVGYGCTTCIGNSGPLDPVIEKSITDHDLIGVSVLSGNRNFEARVHQNIKANFLMSPPLVVAYALAGTIFIDFEQDPIGADAQGNAIYLRDIWPSENDIQAHVATALDPENYRRRYRSGFENSIDLWNDIDQSPSDNYHWSDSTYIQKPPFFNLKKASVAIARALPLGLFGDSVTTDHISPAGAIAPSSPAGKYLQSQGISVRDFNSYGSRRGNHDVMLRGTFANVRVRNLMLNGEEGGYTLYRPTGEKMSIYDAAMAYQKTDTPLIIIAGHEYGTGSSRDWAAKGTRLLGVRAVVARSFERIHRSNLVGMGVLPFQFANSDDSIESLSIDGSESFSIIGIESGIVEAQSATLIIHREGEGGDDVTVPLRLRVDTPTEVEYIQSDGILPFVFNHIVGSAQHAQ